MVSFTPESRPTATTILLKLQNYQNSLHSQYTPQKNTYHPVKEVEVKEVKEVKYEVKEVKEVIIENKESLKTLMEMGFLETERNKELLKKHSGDLSSIVKELLGM